MKNMNWLNFRTQVSGKWVLAGEHSVLKGCTAIALPRQDMGLTLTFEASHGAELTIEPIESEPLIRELISTVSDALESTGKSFTPPQGHLKIESSIPIGAGLGSSAALCVALTRWMAGPLSLSPSECVSFSTLLEHRFHGRSSGMDVAVISAGEAISYVGGQGVQPLGTRRLPHFTFHDTGIRSKTSDCVLRVENLRQVQPALGVQTDLEMGAASQLALKGLVLFDSGEKEQALGLLKNSMQKAQSCFYAWGLVPDKAVQMEKQLLEEGALAVKLTGAGGGGVLVALWP